MCLSQAFCTPPLDVKRARASHRPKQHPDLRVLRRSDIVSRAEQQAIQDWLSEASIEQRARYYKLRHQNGMRHSFLHGRVSKALTVMALYAVGCEILHDFHLVPELLQPIMSVLETKHAVGLIALSHLNEHIKEYLEHKDQKKPPHIVVEKLRADLQRIFAHHDEADPAWPPHLRKKHAEWTAVRGNMGKIPLDDDNATVCTLYLETEGYVAKGHEAAKSMDTNEDGLVDKGEFVAAGASPRDVNPRTSGPAP